MYQVYVLKSINHWRFYVGFSSDITRRLKEQNSGKTRSTRPYAPWKLFLLESHTTRAAAREREKYLKSGTGKEYIKRMWREFEY